MGLDQERRVLERRIAADPSDDGARIALLALDEREGRPFERFSPAARDELRRRSINDGDALAQALLEREWAAEHRVVVETVEGWPLVGVFGGPDWGRVRVPDEEEDVRAPGEEPDGEERVIRADFPTPRLLTAPPVGTIAGVPHKAPLWDREVFGDGVADPVRDFFRFHAHDRQGRRKAWPASSGPFPSGYAFFLYSFVLLVDAGSDAAQAEHFWNQGVAFLRFGNGNRHEWPARACMLPPRGIPTSEVARARMVWPLGGVDVTVAGRPVQLRPMEDWCLRVECEGLACLPVMAYLRGIRVRPSY